jgi:hypothetical protein
VGCKHAGSGVVQSLISLGTVPVDAKFLNLRTDGHVHRCYERSVETSYMQVNSYFMLASRYFLVSYCNTTYCTP